MKNRFIIICFVLFLSIANVNASDGVGLKINGQKIQFENDIIIKDNRTFLPLEEVCKVIGLNDFKYDDRYKMFTINDDVNDKHLFMAIDIDLYQLNAQIFNLDVPPMLVDGVPYVPIRFVAEAFEFDVAWDNDNRCVILDKSGYIAPEEYIYVEKKEEVKVEEKEKVEEEVKEEQVSKYDEDELLWLGRIVTVEARGLSYEGKLAIANVVLNRVKSSKFPSSVHGVIFQIDSGYVQFPPAHKKGFSEIKPSKVVLDVCKDALDGKNNIENCLYFNNRPFKSKADDFFKEIEGEYFYK